MSNGQGEEIDQMLRSLKHHLILYRCDDAQGELVSVMGCHRSRRQSPVW
jgi:hypothetical protein